MFSTVTGVFHASLSFCANRRAVMSVALPAVKPTTMRTGREGRSCARAIRDTHGSAATPAARCRNLRRGSVMSVPPACNTMRTAERKGAYPSCPRPGKSNVTYWPVIVRWEEMHGFGLETNLHVLLDARLRGHDSRESAPGSKREIDHARDTNRIALARQPADVQS